MRSRKETALGRIKRKSVFYTGLGILGWTKLERKRVLCKDERGVFAFEKNLGDWDEQSLHEGKEQALWSVVCMKTRIA